jgi:hypothetical protein
LERALVFVSVLLTVILLGAGLFPALRPIPSLSTAVTLLLLGALGWALSGMIRDCLRRVSPEAAALYVEAKHPEVFNNLISALQAPAVLEKHPPAHISRPLVERLLEIARRQIETLTRQPLVEWRGVRRQLGVVAPLAVAALGLAWIAPQLLVASAAQLLDPFGPLTSQQTVLTLGEYPPRILMGQALSVRVTAQGQPPADVRLRSWHGGKEREDRMLPEGRGAFHYTFAVLRAPVQFQATARSATSEMGQVDVVEAPAVGNFRVRYQYPEYTRLSPKVEEGTGHIEALAGSEVRIEMAANKPIAEGKLVFDDATQLPLLVRAGGLLSGTAIVTKPGGYHIEVKDTQGFANQDTPHYRIDVIPDAPPQIDLLAPDPELEIEEGRVIPLEYEARDDFGVKNVTLVYRVGRLGEKRVTVDRVDDSPPRYRGKYHWDVTALLSDAGEAITYFLEVWDNDTVSGPKSGVSKTQVLRLKSRTEEHRRLEEVQREVAEKLADLLADQLDLNERTAEMAQEPRAQDLTARQELEARQAELQQQAKDMVSQLDQMLQTLEKDYLSDYSRYEDTQTLRNHLNFTQNTLMEGARQRLSPRQTSPFNPQEQGQRNSQQPGSQPSEREQPALDEAMAKQRAAQSELERLTLFAQDIGKRAKMRDLENLAQRMARTQNNLLDTLNDLDKLGKEMDEATRAALQRELDDLEKAMRELMEALSRLPAELPDEFLNSEALQELELGQMLQTLQQLREQLAQGNLNEAKRLAQQMLNALNRMLAALQSAQRFAQSMPFGRQQSGMERSLSELEKIAQEQSEVLRETGGVDKQLRQRVNEQQRREFDQLQREIQEALQQARRQLNEAARAPVGDGRRLRPPGSPFTRLERALDRLSQNLTPEQAADLLQSLQDAQRELEMSRMAARPDAEALLERHPELKEMLQDLRESLKRAQERLADLSALDGQELLDPQQREQLGQLGQREEGLQARTGALKERLDQLSQFIPFLSPEVRQNIAEAGELMGEARGELDQRRARQAVPPEQEALRRLSQAQESMQQAMQQMAQRGQMGPIPVPMVMRRPGDPFAFNPQPLPDRSPWEQGRMGINTRDFKIPGKDEYRAPRQFREEIMEALKQGGPSLFKGQIERYFKNLTE